jgi:hypothetical protein
MTYRSILFIAALALPATLSAQRAGVGRADPTKEVSGDMEPPTMPEAKEIEKGTPAAVALDKKKKLALTDSQVVLLTALRTATADSNHRAYVSWDSVRAELLIGGKSPTVDPADIQRWRRSIQLLYQGLSARNQWARGEATQLLTEEQRSKAREYWDDVDEQDQKWLRPRGRSGGAARGGRRPPSS